METTIISLCELNLIYEALVFLCSQYSIKKTWKQINYVKLNDDRNKCNVNGKLERENKKKWLNRGEKSDIYLTHVCSLLQSVENLKKIEKTGAFCQHCDFHQLWRETK